MKTRMRLSLSLFLLLAVQSTGALAATISYSSSYGVPVGVQPDWNTNLSLAKFNPGLGTLTGVTVSLTGNIFGSIGVENMNLTDTRTINAALTASMTVNLPNAATLTANPTSNQTFILPKFDLTDDKTGTSGETRSNLTATNQVYYYVLPADLALFTGFGNQTYHIAATDASFATGGGNTSSSFSNVAGALLQVTYDYTPGPVPEPATMLLFGGGAGALALMRRRKKNAAANL